jgi:hypothetical protein
MADWANDLFVLLGDRQSSVRVADLIVLDALALDERHGMFMLDAELARRGL